jgi:membrane-associated HD superfamily phosphohydrolase
MCFSDLPLMENAPHSSKGAVNFDALTRFKHAAIYAAGFVVSYLLVCLFFSHLFILKSHRKHQSLICVCTVQMLVVMTFNAGYFIVMAIGALLGHFWFPNDASDCH